MSNHYCRIIGGRWRGRRLSFPDVPGLRPSGDRIRETLFNWLQSEIQDAICLDLFAGSGALGFEALSRGASSATLVDKSVQIVQSLKSMQEKLSAVDARIVIGEAPSSALQKKLAGQHFSVVFIDPPFRQGLVATTCEWLSYADFLAPNALIYIEAERELSTLPLPQGWVVLKSKFTGQVGYHLCRCRGSTDY